LFGDVPVAIRADGTFKFWEALAGGAAAGTVADNGMSGSGAEVMAEALTGGAAAGTAVDDGMSGSGAEVATGATYCCRAERFLSKLLVVIPSMLLLIWLGALSVSMALTA